MATRSTISVQHKDGSISSIYCHWDGYPSHHAPILLEHYNSLELAEQLVSHGSLSLLDDSIEPTGAHTFENPEDGVCIYYGRDRGESNTKPSVYDTKESFLLRYNGEDFNYLFSGGFWWIVDKKDEPQLLSGFDVTMD
jgi:hypothetical protein